MNTFPHILIAGATGSGKSRLLMTLLTNLIHNHNNIELYLIQIRKSDISIFKDCKQTKYLAKTLEETLDVLKYLNNICTDRENIVDNHSIVGVNNIEDFNNKIAKKKKEISGYLCIDSFFFCKQYR